MTVPARAERNFVLRVISLVVGRTVDAAEYTDIALVAITLEVRDGRAVYAIGVVVPRAVADPIAVDDDPRRAIGERQAVQLIVRGHVPTNAKADVLCIVEVLTAEPRSRADGVLARDSPDRGCRDGTDVIEGGRASSVAGADEL